MALTSQVALSSAFAAACNTDGRLEIFGVGTAFGVISIHNMPILDAISRRGNINYGTSGKPRRMPGHGPRGVRWPVASPAIRRWQ